MKLIFYIWAVVTYTVKVCISARMSYPTTNINSLIRPFEDCLVHLTTFRVFEQRANKSNGGNELKELNEHMSHFEIPPINSLPIVISSYKAIFPTVPSEEDFDLKILPNNEISERSAFLFNPSVTKGRECYIDLYSLSF